MINTSRPIAQPIDIYPSANANARQRYERRMEEEFLVMQRGARRLRDHNIRKSLGNRLGTLAVHVVHFLDWICG